MPTVEPRGYNDDGFPINNGAAVEKPRCGSILADTLDDLQNQIDELRLSISALGELLGPVRTPPAPKMPSPPSQIVPSSAPTPQVPYSPTPQVPYSPTVMGVRKARDQVEELTDMVRAIANTLEV